MRDTLTILHCTLQHQVPLIVEHPASSYIFHTEELREVMAMSRVHSVVLDECAFGVAFRKRTRSVISRCGIDRLGPFFKATCRGRTVCDFTGRRHVQVVGKALCVKAQEYPQRFAACLAKSLVESARDK